MTARQPQTPHEAAMLDPMGLLSFPTMTRSRGLFGSAVRRPYAMAPSRAGASLPPQYAGTLTPSPVMTDSPPSIDQAPPPPADWQQTLGPDVMAQLPKTLARNNTRVANGDTTQPLQAAPLLPAPAMRAGMLGSPNRPLGMFGNAASLPMSEKIANGATLPMDANGKGKKGFDWRMVAGIVGDALLGLNGQQPLYAMTRIKENQAMADHQRRLAEQQQEWQYRNSQPDYATVGNRRFAYNPATGESQTLYVAPSEAQDYAAALGAEPGTQEYETLMADYVLRHSGPTATANAMQEEDNRQTNRIGLEGVRQQNRIGIEGVRQGNRMSLRRTPTYRDTHPRPSGAGRGVKIVPGETVIVGPGGKRQVVRGGKWVDVQ